MNVKKLFRRRINADHEEGQGGIISVESSLPLSSLSGPTPDNVRMCPHLAIGSLFDHSLRLSPSDLAGPHCLPCWLSMGLGPRSSSFNDARGLPLPSPPAST